MFFYAKNIRPMTIYISKVIYNNRNTYVSNSSRTYCKSTNTEDEIVVSGLAKALGKFRELEKADSAELKPKSKTEDQKSFLHLLRHSEFVQMGDPAGKIVIGQIFQVVNTDLYIDFGGKFYCVCRRPKRNSEMYVRNAKVKLRINELELCARFLGATEDLTLTEAGGTLLDLVWTPLNSKKEATTQAQS